MNARLVGLLVAALLPLIVPTTANAYVPLPNQQCASESAWPDQSLPVTYYINRRGSDDIADFSRLEQTVARSFAAWEQPCCSNFSAAPGGKTDLTALDSAQERGNQVVLSFHEQNWPPHLGVPYKTVAVTSPAFRGCEIVDATIAYNGTTHTFAPDAPAGSSALDLRNVTTHEIGHLLGLGHSSGASTTMAPKYHGEMETLAADDVNGVCSLYSGGQCNCTTDSACPGERVCESGECVEPPCRTSTDCASGEVCLSATGRCVVPNCNVDSDCPSDFRCGGAGTCVPSCTVCRSCTTRADCGPNGVCAELEGRGRCIAPCGRDGGCPGDSECFPIRTSSGQLYDVCLNPGADSGNTSDICPDSYRCSVDGGGGDADAGSSDTGGEDVGVDGGDTGPPPGASCPSLGNACSATDNSRCGSDADGCMVLASGRRICTCSCEMDRDCGAGNSCIALPNGSWCFPNESQTAKSCREMSCREGFVCRDGECVRQGGADDPSRDAGSADGGPDVVVLPGGGRGGGCSTSGPTNPPALPAGVLALLAIVGIRRRDP